MRKGEPTNCLSSWIGRLPASRINDEDYIAKSRQYKLIEYLNSGYLHLDWSPWSLAVFRSGGSVASFGSVTWQDHKVVESSASRWSGSGRRNSDIGSGNGAIKTKSWKSFTGCCTIQALRPLKQVHSTQCKSSESCVGHKILQNCCLNNVISSLEQTLEANPAHNVRNCFSNRGLEYFAYC